MEKLYLLFGLDYIRINEERNKIIESSNIDDTNVSIFDFEECSIDSLLNECLSAPFFSDYRIVVLKNANIFQTAKKDTKNKSNKQDNDLEQLKKYLENPCPTTVLIFECLAEKIDSKKSIVKSIENNGKIIECPLLSEAEIVRYTNRVFKMEGVIIDDDAIRELFSRIIKNPINYKKEVEKVVIYSSRVNRVTKDVINALIINDVEKGQFDLINGILEKNKKLALEAYYDYIKRKMEPLIILKMIINKFEEILYSKELLREGASQTDFVDFFKVSAGYAYYIMKNAKNTKYDILESRLRDLKNLELDIKTSKVDVTQGLELYLLKL